MMIPGTMIPARDRGQALQSKAHRFILSGDESATDRQKDRHDQAPHDPLLRPEPGVEPETG